MKSFMLKKRIVLRSKSRTHNQSFQAEINTQIASTNDLFLARQLQNSNNREQLISIDQPREPSWLITWQTRQIIMQVALRSSSPTWTPWAPACWKTFNWNEHCCRDKPGSKLRSTIRNPSRANQGTSAACSTLITLAKKVLVRSNPSLISVYMALCSVKKEGNASSASWRRRIKVRDLWQIAARVAKLA